MPAEQDQVQWKPSEHASGYDADIAGILFLHVDLDPIGWQVHYGDDFACGVTATVEQAKRKAMLVAEGLLLRALAALRGLDKLRSEVPSA